MTTVGFRCNNVNYDLYVIQMDLWREALNGIGRWEVICDPKGMAWIGNPDFNPDRQVELRINTVLLMRGYLDDVQPFLDTVGHHKPLWKFSGRDRGMDLAQHYVSGRWQNTAADAIIGNAANSLLRLITGVGATEIDRVTTGAAPGNIDYEADKTYLADAVRDIAQLINYDFYVEDTAFGANANLNFFDVGNAAEFSGVQLRSISEDATNNILRLEFGERMGFNIKNYVEVQAGSLEDHYTDLNANHWTGFGGDVPSDDTNFYLNGKSGIRITNSAGGTIINGWLDFSAGPGGQRYTYASLDLSEPATGAVNIYIHYPGGVAIKKCRPRLIDVNNSRIEFYRAIWGAGLGFVRCPNCTENLLNDHWHRIEFPIGIETMIEAANRAGDTKGHWWQVSGPTPFDWSQVEIIEFTSIDNCGAGDFFTIDGLTLPNVEVRAIASSVAEPPGRRMVEYFRPDIKNQVELDDVAISELAKLETEKETLHIIAEGRVGSQYAAQSLEVCAPYFGIGTVAPTYDKYRILRLHHSVVLSSDESIIPGYTFLTEYELVKYQEPIDPDRVIMIRTPTMGLMRKLRREQQYRRKGTIRLTP